MNATVRTTTPHDIDHGVSQMYHLVGIGLWGLLPTHLREEQLEDARCVLESGLSIGEAVDE